MSTSVGRYMTSDGMVDRRSVEDRDKVECFVVNVNIHSC